jgi:hypothetical protein
MIEEISKDRGFAGKNIQKAGSCSTDSNWFQLIHT